MARSNPVTDAPTPPDPAPAAVPTSADPMAKYKTVLPNGLIVYNFVETA